MNRNYESGFTIIELLTVTAVIGILGAISLVNFEGYKDKAKVSVAQSQLHGIQLAVGLLEQDTQMSPGGFPLKPCDQSPEFEIDDPALGLVSNPGGFVGWKGPYIKSDQVLDPWGRKYIFDPDFLCSNQKGCLAPGWVRALVSRAENTGGVYSSEKIVQVLCTH